MRGVKAVSVSAQGFTTIQRAVEGAGLLVEVGRHGGVEDEESGAFVSAILDLVTPYSEPGRAARGTLDAEVYWASHNAAVDDTTPGEEDVILYPVSRKDMLKKRR